MQHADIKHKQGINVISITLKNGHYAHLDSNQLIFIFVNRPKTLTEKLILSTLTKLSGPHLHNIFCGTYFLWNIRITPDKGSIY